MTSVMTCPVDRPVAWSGKRRIPCQIGYAGHDRARTDSRSSITSVLNSLTPGRCYPIEGSGVPR